LLFRHSPYYFALLLHRTLRFCFLPCYFTSLCYFILWPNVLSHLKVLSYTIPYCFVLQLVTKDWASLI
jgi:hypothetical protein